MALLVFKTSVGFERTPGGFDPHSPPPNLINQSPPHSMPRRALQSALAAVCALGLLIHGYTRPGLRVVEKRATEAKTEPDVGAPTESAASLEEKTPAPQKTSEDVSSLIREQAAIVHVTNGTIARTADGELRVSEPAAGSAKCPT